MASKKKAKGKGSSRLGGKNLKGGMPKDKVKRGAIRNYG